MNCVQSYFESDFSKQEKPAIVFFKGLHSLKSSKHNISFATLSRNAAKAQTALNSLGFKRGDVILLFEAPSPDMYAMIMAMLASGIKLMIVEPWMPIKNINSIIEQTSPKGFMSGVIGKLWSWRTKSIREIPQCFNSSILHKFTNSHIKIESMAEDDEAILTFTSGTSGKPKGVHRKHKYLIDQANVLKKHMGYQDRPGMDLTIFTNVTLLNLGMGKGSLLVPQDWKKKVLQQLDQLPKEYQPDTLSAGPAFLIKLMKDAKVSSLKSFHLGGALADTSIYERAFQHWPKAKFTHVYGSSEAEPVALSDLKKAVRLSIEKGFFQTLFLGTPIKDIEIDNSSKSLWVTGPHVSPEYKGDEKANEKNKRKDHLGRVWHNMGDRIIEDEAGLWYTGRDFQEQEDFKLEQEIYSKLRHSKCFIHRNSSNEVLVVGELSTGDIEKVKELGITNIIKAKIHRDKRHRARIDRIKTLKKANHARN